MEELLKDFVKSGFERKKSFALEVEVIEKEEVEKEIKNNESETKSSRSTTTKKKKILLNNNLNLVGFSIKYIIFKYIYYILLYI